MPRYILISLFLLFANTVALAELPLSIDSSVQQKISDSVLVNILKTNDEQVNVFINIETTAQKNREFHANLLNYSYMNGVSITTIGSLIGHSYQLQISGDQLNSLLKFLSKEQSTTLNALSKFDFNISGKINEQKLLGNFYSQWDQYSISPKHPDLENKIISITFPDELYKSKEEYWTWVIAALINCNHQSLNDIPFELNVNTINCIPANNTVQISDGNIANLKSNFYEYFNIKLSSSDGILQLLSQFRTDNNYDELLELAEIIPNLSIESISQVYHSLASENPKPETPISTVSEDKVKVVSNPFHNAKFLHSDSNIWEVGLFFKNKQNLCQILNCDLFSKKIEFKLIDGQSQGLVFKFSKRFHEKYLSLIHDLVIKPLVSLDSSLSQDNISLLVLGTDNSSPFSKILSSLSILPLTEFQMGDKQKNIEFFLSQKENFRYCFSVDVSGTIDWSKNLLLSYILSSELKQFNEWVPMNSNCLSLMSLNNMSLEERASKISGAINTVVSESNTAQFETIRKAILNRINILDEHEIQFLSFSANLKVSSKDYIIEQLSSMTYEEYKYYLDNNIVNNIPNITLFARNVQDIDLDSIKSYAETPE